MAEKFIPGEVNNGTALHAAWLLQHLPACLWREDETPRELTGVEVVQTWWSKKRVTILYRLQWRGPEQTTQVRLYTGYWVPADQLAHEYQSIAKKAKLRPAEGRAVFMVPEANLVMLAFPNDRKLRLLTEEELHVSLEARLQRTRKTVAKMRKRWRLQAARLEILRYVPDRRFTSRCHVLLQRKGGRPRSVSFIAKQFGDFRKARRLYNTLAALEKSWLKGGRTAAPRPGVRFPRALAWHQEKAQLMLEDLPGKNLEHALPEIDLAKTLAAVGEMLARFHASRKRVPKKVSLKSELKEVRAAMRNISEVAPASRRRLRAALADLRDSRWEEREPPVLLHGTFRLNHVFVHRDELALLDLDSLRMGPPAYDVANFFSSLYYFEAEQRITALQRREIVRHFSSGYAAQTAHALAPRTVLWFLASLLINKQAEKYATHFHPDRAEKIERMLALAETVLRRARELPEKASLAQVWEMLP